MIQTNQNGFKEHRRGYQGNTEPKNQFRLSQFPSEGVNIAQIEHINRIAHLQAENKMTTVFDIFELKVLNRYDFAFSQLKNAQDPFLVLYTHNKTAIHLASAFFIKLSHFFTQRSIHTMGSFMTNLKQMTTKTRNQNSKREMMRANSRVDRDYDDFQVLQRNNHEGNAEKTHKMLVKKKEKNEKEMALFKLQMEQLLAQHQATLKKKN